MAFQIRISPDKLREAAAEQKNIRNILGDAAEELKSIAVAVGDAWDGTVGQMVLNCMDDIRRNIRMLSDGVEESTNKLSIIASLFEAADEGQLSAVPSPRHFVGALGAIAPVVIVPSAGMIRIVPEAVYDSARRCRMLAELLSQQGEEFLEVNAKLRAEWEGKASAKYEAEAREIAQAFYKLADVIQDLSAQMIKTVKRYEDLDNML